MRELRNALAGITFALCMPVSAFAGFDVTFWSLNTVVVQDSTNSDVETINDIQNPFIYTSLSEIGQNSVSAAMDLSWLMDAGQGVFHADVEQHIRSPEVRTQAINVIHILPTEPLRVTLTGSLTYAYTPGDEAGFNFNASVRDLSANQVVLGDQNRGGNLYLLPSSGTLTMNGEAILQAGTPYRLQYVYDCHNTGDPLPTGIMDSAGFIRFEIHPLPEPATLSMLFPSILFLARRRRRALSA